MSIMELFKFVTDVSFNNEDAIVDARLEQIQEEMNANPNMEINTIEDEIFMKSYIPTTLDEVIDIDRDTLIVEEGGGRNLVYADLLGTGVTTSIQQLDINDESEQEDSEQDSDEDDSESDSEDENGERKPRTPRGKKNEDKDDKKDRKKKTKEEARERRKHKLPKAEKKRKIKTSCKKKK